MKSSSPLREGVVVGGVLKTHDAILHSHDCRRLVVDERARSIPPRPWSNRCKTCARPGHTIYFTVALLKHPQHKTTQAEMTGDQVKPLIEIQFIDAEGQKIFDYVCDFHHLMTNSIPNKTKEKADKLENIQDKVIRGKNIDEDKEFIDNLIQKATKVFEENYEINEKSTEVEIRNISYKWKIKKLNFDKHTILRDLIEYGDNMTFTSKNFKYLGNNREFEVSENEVRISEVDGSTLLHTLKVDWERYETVGSVISRARKKYDATTP